MKNTLAVLSLFVLLFGTAQAALVDRGGGLIYDTDLNITWLQNANLAANSTFGAMSIAQNAVETFGIRPDGAMSWATAQSWIGAMNAFNYLGYNDWRLPTTDPLNGSTFDYNVSYNGSTDYGYNVSEQGTTYAGSTASEMANLFYNSLNNKSFCDPAIGSHCEGPQIGWSPIKSSGLFTNIQPNGYWSGTEFPLATNGAWDFNFGNGVQASGAKIDGWYAWAVRDGDVAAVPIPATVWLLGSGLMGLFGVARKHSVTRKPS